MIPAPAGREGGRSRGAARLPLVVVSASPTPPRAKRDSGMHILVGAAAGGRSLPPVTRAVGGAKAAGAHTGVRGMVGPRDDVRNDGGRFASREGMLAARSIVKGTGRAGTGCEPSRAGVMTGRSSGTRALAS